METNNVNEVLEEKTLTPNATEPINEMEENVLMVEDDSIEKNVRLLSPGRMILRRFFRSKLSIIGLIMVVGLFLFCWLGPLFYTQWSATLPFSSVSVADH